MLMQLAEFGAMVIAAMIGAVIIMALLRSRDSPGIAGGGSPDAPCESAPVFLFCGKDLIDATPQAWSLVGHGARNLSDLDALTASVAKEFPTLKKDLADPASVDFRIQSESDPTVFMHIQRLDDRLRISLNSDDDWARELASLRMSCDASNAEAALMRDITMHSTQLVWQDDADGNLVWANDAYQEVSREMGAQGFADAKADFLPAQNKRVALQATTETTVRWFDVSTVSHADGRLHFANDATEIVKASTAKSEFVETLGKTFADLSIGLAIFNKDRLLTLFNPAFLDMTGLPFDFLSAKPAVDTVLDRLRELRMMPEPKDYASWRAQFSAVENGAKDGTYCKNWSLADGQTYRVTGRPHPDGAFALLFEDISAEVSLTRRFRLDIETGQAVLDTLSDAIAVFSSTGTLVMSNQSYAALWSGGPGHILEHRVLQSEMKTWQDQCIPTPMWNDMREFIQEIGSRQPWSDDALLDDGRQLHCHANRIAGGMTMVRFVIARAKRPEIRKLMLPDRALQAGKR